VLRDFNVLLLPSFPSVLLLLVTIRMTTHHHRLRRRRRRGRSGQAHIAKRHRRRRGRHRCRVVMRVFVMLRQS
jgi:hypothetical protein